MAQRITVIINSNKVRPDDDKAVLVAAAFAAIGCEPFIEIADGDRLAACAVTALQHGSTTVVDAGGDGTVSTIASTLVGRDAALGILPMGTLNHFARDMHIPRDLDAAVRVIAAGHRVAVDVGEVNGRFFINNSSIGAYPNLVSERDRRLRRGLSKWRAHILAAFQVWRQHRRVRLTLREDTGERRVRTPFLFVGNNEYELEGTRFGLRRALDRETLHVCMAPGMSRAGAAKLIIAALLGRVHSVERFESHVTSALSLDAGHHTLPLSLDGEVAVLPLPLHYRIRPRALEVIAPDPADIPAT